MRADARKVRGRSDGRRRRRRRRRRLVDAVVVTLLGGARREVRTVRGIVVVADAQLGAAVLELAETEDEQAEEAELRDEVEHAVEDGLGVGRDDVAALAEAPGDRVEQRGEAQDGGRQGVGAADVAAERARVLAAGDEDVVEHGQEGGEAEGEVAPLVARADEGADEAAHDDDLDEEDGEEDDGPRHGGGQEQQEQRQRSRDEPGGDGKARQRGPVRARAIDRDERLTSRCSGCRRPGGRHPSPWGRCAGT